MVRLSGAMVVYSANAFSPKVSMLQKLAQRLAFDIFGSDEMPTRHFADVVNGRDVWMVERRSGLGFFSETLQAFGILREQRRQQLKRDFAMQPFVFGQIDFAHAARAQQRNNLEIAEAFALQQRLLSKFAWA